VFLDRRKTEKGKEKEKEKVRNLFRRKLIKLGVFLLPSAYIIFDGTKNRIQAQTLVEPPTPAPKIRITDMKGKKKREKGKKKREEEDNKIIKRISPKSFDSDRQYEKDKRILNKKTEKGYRSVFEKYGSVGEDE
jgi:hypothetical protein